MHPPRLLSNAMWSLAGNTFYAVCQWAMLVALTKLGSPLLVGQFAMGLAISAPVFLFANLQIRAIQSTDVAQEFSFGEYLGLRLLTSAGALLVILGITAAAGYEPEMKRVILAVSLAKAFEAVSDVFHGDLQRRERMGSIARYLSFKGMLSAIGVALGVKLFGSASVAALAMAGVFAAVLLLGEARLAVNCPRPQWNMNAFRRLGAMAAPLGLVMMLISVTLNMPRYYIEHWMGSHALGVFAALTYLTVAGSTIINAVGLAVTPRLARHFAAEERSAYFQILFRMGVLAALMTVGGIGILAIAGRPVLTLVYGAVYAEHLQVAIWIMGAAGLSYAASVLGYGMTAARCFRPQFPLFFVVTMVAALSSLLLVPRYGLIGAAGAQMIAAGTQLAGSAGILLFALRRPAVPEIVTSELVA